MTRAKKSRPVHVSQPPRAPRRRATLVRSAVVGVASGLRSSYGISAALLARPDAGPAAGAASAVAVALELMSDKLPAMPSRVQPPALAVRCAAGAGAGAALGRRDGTGALMPALLGGAAAVAGSYAGVAWRESDLARRSPVRAALLEDVFGLVLTTAAVRAGR